MMESLPPTPRSSVRRFLTGGTIASQMLFWFLGISLIPLGLVTLFIYLFSAHAIEEMVRDNLKVISEAKANQLEAYAMERTRFVSALARSPSLIEACQSMEAALAKSETVNQQLYQKALDKYGSFLTSFADTLGYPDLMLISPAGLVLFSTHNPALVGTNLTEGEYKNTELALLVDRARTLLQPDISEFAIYPGQKEPAAYVGGPILKEGLVVGLVVVQISNRELYAVVNDYTGLGETGETLVFSKIGNQAMSVAPLRHDPEAAFKRSVPLGNGKYPAVEGALQGENGWGLREDYRGVPGIAVWGYLPSFRWGMIVKQDTDEAFELVQQQGYGILFLAVITTAAVVVIALFIARTFSRPIREAAHAAACIAEGDLTTPVHVRGRCEVGQLLAAIKTMTGSLNTLVGRMQSSSRRLLVSAGQIGQTSQGQEEVVQHYGASTTQIAAAISEMSATGQELARTMNDVSTLASGTATLAGEGRAGLSHMQQAMLQLSTASRSIAGKLTLIHDKAEGIDSVITTITKVADQTNLLSINAAIEAERAGQYGRGFQVVAGEINRLADQTAVATLDIERMVQDMHAAVSAGVSEMSAFSTVVQSCVDSVNKIGGQLGEIIEQVEGLNLRFEQVSTGMQHGVQATGQISSAMTQLVEGAQKTKSAVAELNRVNLQLSEAAESLQNEVSRFKVET